MNEENTEQIPPYIERLFAAIADMRAEMRTELSNMRAEIIVMNERLTNLEEKVDARLRETRPIWEAVLARIEAVEEKMDRMNEKFDMFTLERAEMLTDIYSLKKRLPRQPEGRERV